MLPTLRAALRYRRLGWSVIPVSASGSKKPLIAWEEFTRRRAESAEIEEWWEENPSANVAVVTGKVSNLVAVDVDDPDLVPLLKKESPLVSVTGRGGHHFFFAYPEGEEVGNRVRVGGRDIDIRGEGGYVVVAPSIHENGNKYRWLKDRKPKPNLQAYLPPFSSDIVPDRPAVETNGSADKWVMGLLQGVSHGARNDAAARLAGFYFAHAMPRDVTFRLIQDWNQRNDPPIYSRELETIVNSVWKTSQRRERQEARVSTSMQEMQEELEDPFRLMSLIDYMGRFGDYGVQWQVKDWLPDRTIAFEIASPGTYKTWLHLDMAVSIASGAPFLGHFPVEKRGPVIVIQQEDYHGQLAERIGTIINSRLGRVISDRDTVGGLDFELSPISQLPIYLHPDRRLRFNDPVVLEALERRIDEIQPRLVIIDPLYSTGDTDDYMAKTVQSMFKLKNLRDQYGCSFLIAHHTKKTAGEGMEREGAWGSQFINAFLETGWQIRRQERLPQELLIRRHFKAAGESTEIAVQFDIVTDHPPYRYEVSWKKSNKQLSQKDDIVGYITDMGGHVPSEDIIKRTRKHRTTIIRRLTRLVEQGILYMEQDGTYSPAQG